VELLLLALEALEDLLCTLVSMLLGVEVGEVVLETELLERPHRLGLPLAVAEWVELEVPPWAVPRLFLDTDTEVLAEQP